MTNNSSLFLMTQAAISGVGHSLHRHPPAWVEQMNSRALPRGDEWPWVRGSRRPVVTPALMEEFSPIDVARYNWTEVHTVFDTIDPTCLRVNLTDGTLFPWWLFFSTTRFGRACGGGVYEIWLIRKHGERKTLLIDSEEGYCLASRKKGLIWIDAVEYCEYLAESSSDGHT